MQMQRIEELFSKAGQENIENEEFRYSNACKELREAWVLGNFSRRYNQAYPQGPHLTFCKRGDDEAGTDSTLFDQDGRFVCNAEIAAPNDPDYGPSDGDGIGSEVRSIPDPTEINQPWEKLTDVIESKFGKAYVPPAWLVIYMNFAMSIYNEEAPLAEARRALARVRPESHSIGEVWALSGDGGGIERLLRSSTKSRIK